MTATSAPFGLRPTMHGSGGILRSSRRPIDPANTTAMYKGSPVLVNVSTGYVEGAATTGRVDGVFIGCEYTDAAGKYNVSSYWPGTANCTNIVAWVMEDPNAIFEVQANGAVALADVGAGFMLATSPLTGSTLTGLSTASLSNSASTGTKQFSLIDIAPLEGNDWGDAYTIVRVKLANSAFAGTLTTV